MSHEYFLANGCFIWLEVEIKAPCNLQENVSTAQEIVLTLTEEFYIWTANNKRKNYL